MQILHHFNLTCLCALRETGCNDWWRNSDGWHGQVVANPPVTCISVGQRGWEIRIKRLGLDLKINCMCVHLYSVHLYPVHCTAEAAAGGQWAAAAVLSAAELRSVNTIIVMVPAGLWQLQWWFWLQVTSGDMLTSAHRPAPILHPHPDTNTLKLRWADTPPDVYINTKYCPVRQSF